MMQQAMEGSAARALGTAIRGGLRVGVQTEAFGRVTIQSSAGAGQLSAQLSLENAKQAATLATHLPGLEQQIGERYGLNVSVQLAGGSASAGSAGGDRAGSQPSHSQQEGAPENLRPRARTEVSPAESAALHPVLFGNTRTVLSSRLDVTA
jgi:hypothetical protein